MTILLEDVLIGARTVFGEARGEPFEGQKAVAHVILNRAKLEGDHPPSLPGRLAYQVRLRRDQAVEVY
jgi:hypothetical protein